MRRLIVAGVAAYCLSLYPAILQWTERTGYDAPIYWQAARGNAVSVIHRGTGERLAGWVYSDRLLPFLRPAGRIPYPAFLAFLHAANTAGLCAVLWLALGLRGRCRPAGLVLAGLVVYHASDALAGGNCTGLLCGLALTPLGALLACAVKPYYVLAVVVHAASFAHRRAVAATGGAGG